MPLGQRLARQMVEHERRVGQIVEQRVEPLVVERQPVLHAGEAPAFAHRRIERIVARRRAERLDVVAAEAADRLRRQRHLAHRLQGQRVALAGGALRRRIEGADGLQRVAEEVEPERLVGPRRIEVENAAAHREFADVAHRRHALEAGIFQPADQHLHVDLVAGPREKVCASMTAAVGMRCSSALAVVSTTARCGFLASAAIAAMRIEPARRRVGAGRDAVVGQAVPGRQLDDRQFRRRECQRVFDRRQPLAVARHEHDRPVRRKLRRRGRQRERLIAVGHAVDDGKALQPFRKSDAVDQCHGLFVRRGSLFRRACSAGMRGCAGRAHCRCRPAPACRSASSPSNRCPAG